MDNYRRAELIRKMNRGGLTPAETEDLQALQNQSRAALAALPGAEEYAKTSDELSRTLGEIERRLTEMTHIDNYPYPVYPQAAPSFGPALQIVTGQSDLDLNCKTKTLHTVSSFAMGQLLPHDHPEVMMTPELEALAKECDPDGCKDGVKGINWKGIIAKLLPLLLAFLSEQQ